MANTVITANIVDGTDVITNVSDGIIISGIVTTGGKGDKGEQGATGPTGPQGASGAEVAATTTVRGSVKLAGDLGGTADLPTTPTAVHITGNETVAGTKTFSTKPLFPVSLAVTTGGGTDKLARSDASGNLSWQFPRNKRVYNVQEYTAVGDGVTDDTNAFNAAITAANAAGGGVVSGLPGTYVIGGTINMKSNVTLDGNGHQFILKFGISINAQIQANAVTNVRFLNFKADCDGQGGNHFFINIIDSTNVQCADIRGENIGGFGIFITATGTNTCSKVWVERCYLNGKGKNDIIGGGPQNSIGARVQEVYLLNNIVYQDAGIGNFYTNAIDLVAPYLYTFSGNNVQGNITFGSEQSPARFGMITNNTVRPPLGKTSGGIFILIDTLATNIGEALTVSDNVIQNGWIYIQNATSSANFLNTVLVANNNINANGADRAAGFAGIKFLKVQYGMITGNVINASTSDGIQVNNSSNCLITNNLINGSSFFGINENAGSANNEYAHNSLTNNTSGAYTLLGTGSTKRDNVGANDFGINSNIERVFNIKDYGAVDNGTTNNTTAIQAACTAATAAGGGIVLVPATTSSWLVSGIVNIPSNVYLKGQGWSSVLKMGLHSGIYMDGVTNSGVSDLLVDALLQGINPSDFAILARNSSNIFIDKVRVRDCGCFGIFVTATGTATCSDVWITRCHLNGRGRADVIGGGPANSTGSVVTNVHVMNNKVLQDATLTDLYSGAIVIVGARNYRYVNNYVEGIVKLGIEQTVGHQTSIISGNIVKKATGGTTSLGLSMLGGITNAGGDVVVANNVIYDGLLFCDNASSADATPVYCKGLSISGNTVYAPPASFAGGTAGLFVYGFDGVAVTGNVVRNSGGPGMWLVRTLRANVTGNTIVDSANLGIKESNNSDFNFFSSNVLLNNTAGAISITGANSSTINNAGAGDVSVTLNGNETITGTKTFLSSPVIGMDAVTDRTLTVGFNTNNRVRLGFETGNSFIEGKDSSNTTGQLLINPNGGVVSVGQTVNPTAIFDVAPSTTANAALRLRSGVAPTTPNDGDIWNTGSHCYVRISGVTYQIDQQSVKVYNVKDYGAKGDTLTKTDGAMTVGSAVLTSASGAFTAADVGKLISVANASATASLTTALVAATAYTSLSVTAVKAALTAGQSIVLGYGANQQTVVTSAAVAVNAVTIPVNSFTASFAYPVGTPIQPKTLTTTIASFQSATQVTLTLASEATVTGQSYTYATNDTTTIQAAIDACNTAGGGTVYFPEGAYRITASLYYRGRTGVAKFNIVFKGAGRTKTIIQLSDGVATNAAGAKVRTVITGAYATIDSPLTVQNGTITNTFDLYDMTLDYNGANQTLNSIVYCLLLDNRNQNSLVHNCSFINAFVPVFNAGANQYGIAANNQDSQFSKFIACTFETSDYGLWLTTFAQGDPLNATVTDNKFKNLNVDGIQYESGKYARIKGNQFDTVGKSGINGTVVNNALDTFAIITNNTINGTGEYGILIKGNNNIVSDNTVLNSDWRGVSVDGKYNTVSGNSLRNVGSGATTTNRSGIFIRQDYNTVEGNTITSPARHGIELSVANYNVVTGNVILDASQEGNNINSGIALTNISTHNIISGNTVSAVATSKVKYGVHESATTDDFNFILDNKVVGAVVASVNLLGVNSTQGDATTTSKGNVQLAGDLGGTAAAPTVPALAGKESTANKGAANGYAPLDATSKVPAANLPSYVDDVLEFANLAGFPVTGTTGIIYVATDTNKTYRWTGTVYVEISTSNAAGATTQLQYNNAGAFAGASALTYDATNNRLGINKATPSETLDAVGNLQVNDAATSTKGYRFRTSGSNLDVDFSGADGFISVFSGANYTGTQRNKLRLESGAEKVTAVGQWNFSDTPFAAAKATIDGLNGLVTATSVKSTGLAGTGVRPIVASADGTLSAQTDLTTYRTAPTLFADFLATAGNQVDPFLGLGISAGTSNSTPLAGTPSMNHPGTIRMVSSTTANSGYYIGTHSSSLLLGNGEIFETVLRFEVFTATISRLGFQDSAGAAAPTDGCWIEIDTAGLATFRTSLGPTPTTTTSTGSVTLALTTWYRFRVVVESASSVVFTIFSEAGAVLLTETLTTNIPTASGRDTGAGIVSTNSGTVATSLVQIDYLAVAFGQTTPLVR